MFIEGTRMLAISLAIQTRKIRGFVSVAVYRALRIFGFEIFG